MNLQTSLPSGKTKDPESKVYRPDIDLAGVAALFSRQNGDERFAPLYRQRFKSGYDPTRVNY